MTTVELDFGSELLPAGGSRHLASENEFELVTEYFWTRVRLAVGGDVVFAGELPLLNFVEMVALSAQAIAEGRSTQVAPEFGGAGAWSVIPERDRVRVEYRRYVPDQQRDVSGSAAAGRAELVSAMAAFTLRALDAAQRTDAALEQNPWTRRIRERARDVLARELDQSIVAVETTGGRVNAGDLRARLACRLWSYGGLPAAVPPPVTVDVLVDPEARDAETGASVAEGRPRVDAIVPPDLAADSESLSEAVLPGFGELLTLYGAADHPLSRATSR